MWIQSSVSLEFHILIAKVRPVYLQGHLTLVFVELLCSSHGTFIYLKYAQNLSNGA